MRRLLLSLCVVVTACGSTAAPGGAASVAMTASTNGNAQTGPVAVALPDPLRIRVVDQNGTPVNGVDVVWSTTDGAVDPDTTVTDVSGVAITIWTLGPTVGPQTAQATVAGVTGSPVTFSATATP